MTSREDRDVLLVSRGVEGGDGVHRQLSALLLGDDTALEEESSEGHVVIPAVLG